MRAMNTTEIERPSFVKEKHLLYLDTLRESGVTNMYGAASYVMQAFNMPREKAVSTLSYWMKTFASRHGKK
jgi:hypothetical protein